MTLNETMTKLEEAEFMVSLNTELLRQYDLATEFYAGYPIEEHYAKMANVHRNAVKSWTKELGDINDKT